MCHITANLSVNISIYCLTMVLVVGVGGIFFPPSFSIFECTLVIKVNKKKCILRVQMKNVLKLAKKKKS